MLCIYVLHVCIYIYIWYPTKKNLPFTTFTRIYGIFCNIFGNIFKAYFEEILAVVSRGGTYLSFDLLIHSINQSIYLSRSIDLSIYLSIYLHIYIYYILYIYVYTYNSGYHRYRQTCETWRFWDQEVLVPPPFKLCLKYNIHWGIFVF